MPKGAVTKILSKKSISSGNWVLVEYPDVGRGWLPITGSVQVLSDQPQKTVAETAKPIPVTVIPPAAETKAEPKGVEAGKTAQPPPEEPTKASPSPAASPVTSTSKGVGGKLLLDFLIGINIFDLDYTVKTFDVDSSNRDPAIYGSPVTEVNKDASSTGSVMLGAQVGRIWEHFYAAGDPAIFLMKRKTSGGGTDDFTILRLGPVIGGKWGGFFFSGGLDLWFQSGGENIFYADVDESWSDEYSSGTAWGHWKKDKGTMYSAFIFSGYEHAIKGSLTLGGGLRIDYVSNSEAEGNHYVPVMLVLKIGIKK